MQRFILPELTVLQNVNGPDGLRANYPNKTPAKLRLLGIVDICSNAIDLLVIAQEDPESLKAVLAGAYVFGIESIAAEPKYRLLNPNFSQGYIWNSGSKLYQAFLKQLGITQNNIMSEQTKFVLISKFYHFLQKNIKFFTMHLGENDYFLLENEVKQQQDKIFARLYVVVEQLKNLTPTEKALDTKMQTMYVDYQQQTQHDNLTNKIRAAFITAICKMTPAQRTCQDMLHYLSSTERRKLGALMLNVQSIWDSYILCSPVGTALYDLNCKALNISGKKGLKDQDVYTQLACFSELNACLTNVEAKSALEAEIISLMPNLAEELKKLKIPTDVGSYISAQLFSMQEKLQEIIALRSDSLKSLVSFSNQDSITKVSAIIAGVIGSVFGGAVGLSGAEFINTVNPLVPAKLVLGEAVGETLKFLVDPLGKVAGYYFGDMMINNALKLSLQAALEVFGGILSGASVGLVVVTLVATPELVNKLWEMNALLQERLEVKLAKEIDPDFVKCLMSLSDTTFSQIEKRHIKEIGLAPSHLGFFPISNSSPLASSPLELASADGYLLPNLNSSRPG